MKDISIDSRSEVRNILYEENAPFQFFFSLVERSPGRETIRLMVVVIYSLIMWSFGFADVGLSTCFYQHAKERC